MRGYGFGILVVSTVMAAILFLPPPGPTAAATSGTVTYNYDSLGRVVLDSNTTGNSGSYSYDPGGNRVTSGIN